MDKENANYKLALDILEYMNFDTSLESVQDDAVTIAEMMEDNLSGRGA